MSNFYETPRGGRRRCMFCRGNPAVPKQIACMKPACRRAQLGYWKAANDRRAALRLNRCRLCLAPRVVGPFCERHQWQSDPCDDCGERIPRSHEKGGRPRRRCVGCEAKPVQTKRAR